MTDYYGYRHYQASPYVSGYYRNDMEYDGYSDAWMAGRERRPSYGPRAVTHHYAPNYGHDAYHQEHSRSRSRHNDDRYNHSEQARLAWATEIPVKLRVSLCCEGCRWKLDEGLRDLEGVYDVGISGWSSAYVTVTGTADSHKILEKARKLSNHAEFWSDSSHYKSWY